MMAHGEDNPLTEVEGAILSEIAHRENTTAFRVRRAFELSPSIEWSGSSGAIYPAIRRLRGRGLIAGEETTDRRATVRLSLTAAGHSAMLAWACDEDRASSVGIDPFRLRAGIWQQMGSRDRTLVLRRTADAIRRNVAFLEEYRDGLDPVEAARIELSLAVQALRLDYVDRQITGEPDDTD